MGVPWKCAGSQHSKVSVQNCEEHAIPTMMIDVLHQCTGPRRSIVCWQHDAGQCHQVSLIGVPYKFAGPQHSAVCWQGCAKLPPGIVDLCAISMRRPGHSIVFVCNIAKRNSHQALPIGMPYQGIGPQHSIVYVGNMAKKTATRFVGMACQSMHRPSAQHCVCLQHGEENGHQDLWIGLPLQCTGPRAQQCVRCSHG